MTASRTACLVGLFSLGLLALAGSPPGAAAATFVVTRTDDDNGPCTADDCALREAVIAANASPGTDRIELPAGVYLLTLTQVDDEDDALLGDLDVIGGLDVVGDPAGPTVIRMTTDDRVFQIAFSRVTFSNVEITGGRQVRDSGATVRGGCVATLESDVTFVDSAITDCYCKYEGGGVVVQFSTMTFLRTTISGNLSETAGGGVFHSGLSRENNVTIVNSTLSGNRARFQGGGLFRRGGGTVLISHSTIADNEAPFGDAILNEHQPMYVQNSIIEGNCRGLFPNTRGGNVGGPDVVDHCFKFSILSTDHAAADLGLLPLGRYGGPTLTHGLMPQSPALDAALATYCEDTDQRGFTRPEGDACDAGAIEGVVNALDVPALSGWGVAVLVLLLGGAAVSLLRAQSPPVSSRSP